MPCAASGLERRIGSVQMSVRPQHSGAADTLTAEASLAFKNAMRSLNLRRTSDAGHSEQRKGRHLKTSNKGLQLDDVGFVGFEHLSASMLSVGSVDHSLSMGVTHGTAGLTKPEFLGAAGGGPVEEPTVSLSSVQVSQGLAHNNTVQRCHHIPSCCSSRRGHPQPQISTD